VIEAVVPLLSDFPSERVDWLAPGWLAKGKISICDGDPGEGKSTLSIDWAAKLTRGLALPGGAPMAPTGVVLISPEDGVADTIRPRFEAAGANLDLVRIFQGGRDVADPLQVIMPPSFPGDIDLLREILTTLDIGLVIIDPLFAALDPNVSAKVDQDIRRALTPLARLAEETRVAVLLIRHLNKSMGGSPLYRGGGSIGIIGVARLGMLVGRDPDDPDARVLAYTKVNNCKPPASIRFRLVESPTNSDVATVEYLGESSYSASELLSAPATKQGEQPESSALDIAKDWLKSWLEDGPKAANETVEMALQAGIKERTLDRAKAALNVKPKRVGGVGKNGAWWWQLPDDEETDTKTSSVGAKHANLTLTTPPSTDPESLAPLASMAPLASLADKEGIRETRETVSVNDQAQQLAQVVIEGGWESVESLKADVERRAGLSDRERLISIQAIAIAETKLRQLTPRSPDPESRRPPS
jgi:hypothetical protein